MNSMNPSPIVDLWQRWHASEMAMLFNPPAQSDEVAWHAALKESGDIFCAISNTRSHDPVSIAARLHMTLAHMDSDDFAQDLPQALLFEMLRDLVPALPKPMSDVISGIAERALACHLDGKPITIQQALAPDAIILSAQENPKASDTASSSTGLGIGESSCSGRAVKMNPVLSQALAVRAAMLSGNGTAPLSGDVLEARCKNYCDQMQEAATARSSSLTDVRAKLDLAEGELREITDQDYPLERCALQLVQTAILDLDALMMQQEAGNQPASPIPFQAASPGIAGLDGMTSHLRKDIAALYFGLVGIEVFTRDSTPNPGDLDGVIRQCRSAWGRAIEVERLCERATIAVEMHGEQAAGETRDY